MHIDPSRKLYKQEGRAGIFQITIPYIAMGKGMRQYIPATCGESWALFKNHHAIAIFYEDNFEKIADATLALAKNGFPKEWKEKWKRIDTELTRASRKLMNADSEKKSLAQLRKAYDELYQLDEAMWNISIFVDSFDTGRDQREMRRIAGLHHLSPEEIVVLVTPIAPSFVTEWETALGAFKNGAKTFEALAEQFFWIATDYADFSELTRDFVESAVTRLHMRGFVSPAAAEKEILAAHHLDHNPLEFFRIITSWRDDRKRLNYTGAYGLVKILREVLRRRGINPELAGSVLPSEVPELFLGTLQEKTLQHRVSDGIFFRVTPHENFEYVFDKQEVEKLWEAASSALVSQAASSELTGMAASRGNVRGRVRIVVSHNDASAASFQTGEVLVTSMTRPEFLPLMKMAGAVVTDEGGITSHAAIISRELKIPCIIGTRVATKVLKDGDLVEVNAEKGIVKILERKG